jgi:putative ABC transport system permease protein
MKYFILIWAGLWRKKTRTILTMLSIVVAFLLFGLLQSISQGLSAVYKDLGANRLFVQNRVVMTDGLPIAYYERIKKVPGVRAVTHWTFFGGYYQEPRNGLTMFATDIATQLQVFPKIGVPQDQRGVAARTRTGLIVSQRTAAKYGWKVGDKVPISTSIWQKKDGSRVYQADVVGIMDVSDAGDATFPQAFLQFDYFDEARGFSNGRVQYYIALIDDPRRATEVAGAIDALFANSADETKTESEQMWAQAQIKQVGDVSLIARSIVGAVLFALLFLTGSTMMQSMRERIPELAVLKTLGYSGSRILTLIVLESVVLCVFAALVGLFFANVIFKGMAALFGQVSLPISVVLTGLGIAVLLALVSGLPPAWRASRLSIVDALSDR